jgi:hypothetical protein
MSRNVPAGNYVVHFDRDRAHHRAWLQAVLERLEKLDPAALSRDGELHAIWTAAVPSKPPERPANSYQALAPLLALIRSGEGTYTSVNRGRAGDTPGGWVGLTSMSLAEVMQAQQLRKVFAVGAYQFIPETLRTAVQVAGLGVTMPFSPEVQDHLATVLILGGKRPALRDYLIGKAASIEAAQLDLAKEWAAIPTAEGRGFYDGDSAGNKATIPVNKVQAALIQSRLNLQDTDLAAITPPPAAAAPKPNPVAITPSSPFATRLTQHFTLGEFALYQEQRRFRHQYQVDTALTLATFLERCRSQFGGRSVIITSGYRPPAVNQSVGGAADSEHLYSGPGVGAVDFFIDGVPIRQVQDWCDKHWPHSLGYGAPKGFVHLGRRTGGPRVRWDY